MNAISPIDVLEAAACALVSERCRPSYLHDIRGQLQALHGAIELLIRAARSPGGNSAMVDKASSLARHALATQEKSLVGLVDQLTPQSEASLPVNVGEEIGDVLRFVRNDLANRSIALRSDLARDVIVLAQAHKFRRLMLGLCTTLADGLDPGTVVHVTVTRSGDNALIEWGPRVPFATVRPPEELWKSPEKMSSRYELLLSLLQRWLSDHGGAFELSSESHLPNALRLFYPVQAKTERAGL